MTKEFWRGLAAAAVVLGIVVWVVWTVNYKDHLQINGKILRVRVESLEPNASIVLVDFRVDNPSAVPFVSREVSLKLEPSSGKEENGMMVSRGDVDTMFKVMDKLRPKYNDVYGLGDTIPPGKSRDYMVEARFELPKSAVDRRQNLMLHLEEVDGAEADISENEVKQAK